MRSYQHPPERKLLIVSTNPFNAFLIFLGSVAGIGFMIFLVIYGFLYWPLHTPSDIQGMIGDCLFFYALSSLLCWLGWQKGLKRLLQPEPVLVCDQQGIRVRNNRCIPWSAIRSITKIEYGGRIALQICYKKETELVEVEDHSYHTTGRVWRSNRPIALSGKRLNLSVTAVLAQIRSRFAEEIQQHQVNVGEETQLPVER